MSGTDLDRLAARLREAASHAGQVARGTEILAARLQVGLPAHETCCGMADAVQHHEQQAQALADAHAFVVRCRAYPDILDVLAALERGATVIIGPDAHDAPAPLAAAETAPARTVVVGDHLHATPQPARPWSRVLDMIRGGHRMSSGPAHHSAPPVSSQDEHGSFPQCRKIVPRTQKAAGR